MTEKTLRDRKGCNISINYSTDTVCIYRQIVEKLGNPRFIKLLINTDEKKLYIVGTDQSGISSIEVPKEPTKIHNSFRLHSSLFLKKISKLMSWNLDKAYFISGSYSEESNAVVFNLLEAVQRNKEEKEGR